MRRTFYFFSVWALSGASDETEIRECAAFLIHARRSPLIELGVDERMLVDTTLNMEKAAPVGQPCGYDHNMLLDNSSEKFRLACCLRTLIANPNCRKIRIATGYWDLPGTNLVYDELKSFLERGGELDLLIGEDPHIHKGHLASLPTGEKFPDFYICQDFEKLTEALRPVAQLLLDYVIFENDSDDASKIKIHIYGKDENERQFLHAKCYIFTDMTGDYARGIVGSSNFTAKGLGGTDGSTDGGNSELNYLETDPVRIWETAATSPVRTHADWFNEKWENSRPWNGRFIWLIKRSAIGHTLVDPPTRNVCAPSLPFTPYETYIKLLQHQYGAIVDAKAATAISSYLPSEKIQLEYQIDAVKQCFAAMRNRGGFMLADVVGLGKTIIAVLVIRHFLDCPDDRPSKVLVVTPPAVKTAWTDTLAEFSIPPAAVDFVTTGSIGNLVETAIEDVDDMGEEADDGDFADALKHENYGLIVVDESHKFRNSTTAMYKALDDLIHRSIDETAVCPYIGLLSATPQNNSPADIKNQIYLFARDRKHSAFDGVPDGGNLEAYFSKVEKTYKVLREKAEEILSRPGGTPSNEMDDVRRQLRALADDVRNKVMNDVLVRRTRTDVQKYYADDIARKNLHFPSIKGPNELTYVLTPNLARLFAETMDLIAPEGEFHFRDANYLCYFRYQAVRFLKDPADKDKYKVKNLDAERFSEQLAHIMQMLLVKRLESSFSAFKESLLNLRRYTENMVAMWDADSIFICPHLDVNEEFEKAGFNIAKVQPVLRAKIAKLDADGKNEQGRNCEYSRSDFDPDYIDVIKRDLELVRNLCDRWTREVHVDPKLDEFRRRLPELMGHAQNIERKLVIFSEAKATVEALCDVVESCGWHGRVLKITAKNRKEKELTIRENFDANFAGEWKNDYDVIVTTEVLAEGVNLHRANFILNYDAPWNATRLMQRIGRVNRIGTQADFVYVYNFMPSAEGDEYIRLVGKAYVKLQSFQSLLGEDSKIFTNAETVETHNLNAITAEDEESAFAPYIAELKTYKAANPERYAQIEAAESVEVAVSTADSAWFTVAPPHGSGLFVQVPTGGEAKVVPLVDMLAACKVQADASAVDLPENWKTLKDEAITAYIHHQAPVKSYFKKSKAVKGAMAYADRLKGDPQFDDADAGEMKKLLTLAKSLAEGGNVDVVQKLNALGARFYSPQMELFPVTPAEICGAIREAFSAIAAAHEAQKGKPCIVTGLSK